MIETYTQLPIILTKDRHYVENISKVKPGDVLLLPEDAILVILPEKHAKKL